MVFETIKFNIQYTLWYIPIGIEYTLQMLRII